MALMNSDYDGPVNIGNPDEYTIKDFAEVRSSTFSIGGGGHVKILRFRVISRRF